MKEINVKDIAKEMSKIAAQEVGIVAGAMGAVYVAPAVKAVTVKGLNKINIGLVRARVSKMAIDAAYEAPGVKSRAISAVRGSKVSAAVTSAAKKVATSYSKANTAAAVKLANFANKALTPVSAVGRGLGTPGLLARLSNSTTIMGKIAQGLSRIAPRVAMIAASISPLAAVAGIAVAGAACYTAYQLLKDDEPAEGILGHAREVKKAALLAGSEAYDSMEDLTSGAMKAGQEKANTILKKSPHLKSSLTKALDETRDGLRNIKEGAEKAGSIIGKGLSFLGDKVDDLVHWDENMFEKALRKSGVGEWLEEAGDAISDGLAGALEAFSDDSDPEEDEHPDKYWVDDYTTKSGTKVKGHYRKRR